MFVIIIVRTYETIVHLQRIELPPELGVWTRRVLQR